MKSNGHSRQNSSPGRHWALARQLLDPARKRGKPLPLAPVRRGRSRPAGRGARSDGTPTPWVRADLEAVGPVNDRRRSGYEHQSGTSRCTVLPAESTKGCANWVLLFVTKYRPGGRTNRYIVFVGTRSLATGATRR
jgi:hypothetical protein